MTVAALPFALFVAATFDVFYLILAFAFGPEFPSLVGAIPTLVLAVVFAKKGWLCPKKPWDFERREAWEKSWLSAVPVKADAQVRMNQLLRSHKVTFCRHLLRLGSCPVRTAQPSGRDLQRSCQRILRIQRDLTLCR